VSRRFRAPSHKSIPQTQLFVPRHTGAYPRDRGHPARRFSALDGKDVLGNRATAWPGAGRAPLVIGECTPVMRGERLCKPEVSPGPPRRVPRQFVQAYDERGPGGHGCPRNTIEVARPARTRHSESPDRHPKPRSGAHDDRREAAPAAAAGRGPGRSPTPGPSVHRPGQRAPRRPMRVRQRPLR
jgi:hypothetical protein